MTTSDSNPQSPRDLATELAALSGLGILDGADAAAMEHCHECPFAQATLAALQFEETTAAVAATVHAPTAPPAELKQSIMAKIEAEKAPTKQKSGYFYLPDQEGEWQSLPGGKIRLKTLSDDPEAGHSLIILEADPGAVFFPHAHKGTEEVFLMSGDLETSDHQLKAGDYLRAEPGTHHSRAVSHQGCRALLVTARENHPRKAIAAYSGLAKFFKGSSSTTSQKGSN